MFNPTRDNRFSTFWHLVNKGHIHISKSCDSQGTWNWSCRHHEDIRIVSFFSQDAPLTYTKAVLLINNNQT